MSEKFKVEDRVRVVNYPSDIVDNQVGRVVGFGTIYVHVRFDIPTGTTDTWLFHEHELELA